ncbi:NAD-P-binding protein [Amylocystis lapponica]|nr:NAD-P-binding protein [Amylocystis lapponica]
MAIEIPQQAINQKVWFITGTSSGFGARLVKQVLARGDLVIATVRRREDFKVPDVDWARVRVLVLDLSDTEERIQSVVDEALSAWGRIDVLVNNAGFNIKGALEELAPPRALAQFQTNVFGTMTLTNAILPQMRERRSGAVVFIGSRTAFDGEKPLIGLYVASKAAIHTLGETYSTELRAFNVNVCIAVPGAFRTENVHSGSLTVDRHDPAYDALRDETAAAYKKVSAHARGDPTKAMALLVDAVRGEGKARGRPLPLWLFLGNVTYTFVREKCALWNRALDEWEDVAKDLDFDE